MDRIALISDIHGNLPALSAVLDDLDRRDVQRIICLGDLVGKGPSGAAVIDICRERCEATVQGNWDATVAAGAHSQPLLRWPREQLSADQISFLANLPFSIDLAMSGQRVRLFHASPSGLYDRVFQEDTPEKHRAMFVATDLTGHGTSPDIVGYGDIHTAYLRTFGHKTLLNAGSVGNALDVPLATYAILEGTQGNAPGPISCTIARIPYDIERAIADAAASGMPGLDAYAGELRTARYRGTS